jgi:ketosteroid isomerase-like protein
VHFERSETIEGISPNAVLSSLETHLRAVSLEVVRAGVRLTAYGIGPSPRSVNPNDKTVVLARSPDGMGLTTVLEIAVDYQASALLGNAAQDEVVWGKVSWALEEMRNDLRMRPLFSESQRRSSQHLKATDSGLRRAVATESRVPEVRVQEPAAAVEMMSAVPGVMAAAVEAPIQVEIEAEKEAAPVQLPAETVVEPEPAEAALEEPVVDHLVGEERLVLEPERVMEPAPEVASSVADPELLAEPVLATRGEAGAAEEKIAEVGEEPVVAGPAQGAGVAPVLWGSMLRDMESERQSRRGGWIAGLVVLLLAVGAGAGYGWLHQDWVRTEWGVGRTFALQTAHRWGIVAAAEPVAEGGAQLSPSQETGSSAGASASPSAPALTAAESEAAAQSRLNEQNVVQWVQNWAGAMNAADADAQAAYYSDPVEHYLSRGRVSLAEVKQDQELAIEDRVGGFSLKVEDVVVEAQSSTQAWVRLVKHYTLQQEGSAAMERRVRSTLHLRKINGAWRIVEERDLA